MLPVKLTIKGLYSYQNKAVIDFTKLMSSNLFGIFGTVGSGKSTILEAITYALYGETTRLNKSDSRNYNMMNLKSSNLFIEFDFYAGADNQKYKVQVTGRRNSKHFDKVSKLERVAYKFENDDLIPIETSQIIDAIGLSYNNFMRTIIIPQGKFMDFLQLGATERTNMMKELFNLNKYDLSEKTIRLERANEKELIDVKARLSQIGEVNSEQIKELNNNLVCLKEELKNTEKLGDENNKKLVLLEKIKSTTLLLKQQLDISMKLSEQKNEINALKKNLDDFEYCNLNFGATLIEYKNIKNNINKYSKELININRKLEKHNSIYEKLFVESKIINDKYNNIPNLNIEIEGIKKIIKVKENSENLEKQEKRFENGKVHTDRVINEIDNLKTEIANSNKSVSKLKTDIPDIKIITKSKEWHSKNISLIDNLNAFNNDLKQIIINKNKLSELLNKKELDIDLSDNKDNWQQEVNKQQEKVNKSLTKIKDDKNNLLVQKELENYAQNLTEDSPCPLCGSTHHPNPISETNIKKEIKKIDEVIKANEDKIKLLNSFEKKIIEYNSSNKALISQEKEILFKIKTVESEIQKHKQNIIAEYPTKESNDKAFILFNNINEQIKIIEEKINKDTLLLDKKNQEKEKYSKALQNIQDDITKIKSELNLILSQVDDDLKEKYNCLSVNKLIGEVEKQIKNIENIQKNKAEIEEKITSFAQIINKLKGEKESSDKHLNEDKIQLKKVEIEINNLLKQSKFEDIETIQKILNQKIDLVLSRKKIEDYNNAISINSNEIKRLKTELGDEKYDEKLYEEVIKNKALFNDKINQLNSQSGQIQLKIKDLKEKIEQKKKFEAQKNKLEVRAENIKTIKSLFRKQGFVNYISSVYLKNISELANQRFFKMTKQSLSLVLNENNSFDVCDFMNSGKTRSIKTLSGGQAFQAALSLALAMADNIQSKYHAKQNFFFLDEGFGTLDKESLNIVFSTLKKLNKENRIVGVISHVEEMQQEVSTFLKITKDNESGSSVINSWDE